MPKIIGIAGTLASGKDTVAQYLVDHYDFVHISTGDIIRNRIRESGKKITRDQELVVGNKLRKTYGADILSKEAVETYRKHNLIKRGLAISGIRNPAEANLIIKEGGLIIFVDANPKIRFARLLERERIGSETSYEQFITNEKRELNNTDPAGQQIEAMRNLATYQIDNDGTEAELFEKIDTILKDL